MTPKYRPDIDGLRAIAVGGVVLYHAFPSLLPGGFIGVDVFFVISGFLITSIIASDVLAGQFSIAGFYERRFRRILPALLVVLIATTMAAVVILPPGELRQYGKSLIAVAFFSSNILFWREGGYFDQPADDKPLLHTWSLSVEEQFYILWPLIVAALVMSGRRQMLPGFVWAIVLGSLLAAEFVVRISPTQAFFFLPYRAWELGFGALLAVGGVPALRSVQQREIAAWAGLLLILAPMFLYNDTMRFPGISALPPCLGALLLIHAGREGTTLAGRLLSLRPILFTGLVSYGFYLWHWPILVLTQIAFNRPLHPIEAAMALTIAFMLAALSLRFVEKPFRKPGQKRHGRRAVLTTSGLTLGLFASVGTAAYATEGFSLLASSQVRDAQAAMSSINPLRGGCHNDDGTADLGPIARCTGGAPSPNGYHVLLWGDSHGDHLVPGLLHQARKDGFALRQATVSGCSPIILTDNDIPPEARPCAAFHRAALNEAARQPHLGAIILSIRWSSTLPALATEAAPATAGAAREQAGVAEMERALHVLIADIRRTVGPATSIILVGSTPEFDIWPATCFARAYKIGGDTKVCANRAAKDARWGELSDRLLTKIANRDGVQLVLPRALFCKGTSCRTAINGHILFRDDDHLTNDGSVFATSPMAPLLAGLSFE